MLMHFQKFHTRVFLIGDGILMTIMCKKNVTNLFHSITNTTKCHKIAVVWQHHNGIISIIHIGEGYKFQKTWYRVHMYVKQYANDIYFVCVGGCQQQCPRKWHIPCFSHISTIITKLFLKTLSAITWLVFLPYNVPDYF